MTTNVLRLLEQDHREVQSAFKQFMQLGDKETEAKKKLADQICDDLLLHTKLEEEVFYPAFRDAVQVEQLANDAKVEHDSAQDLIEQIQSMKGNEELFDAKVRVLSEYIDLHVREEEEDMFPAIRDSEANLDEIGRKLKKRKEELA